MAGAPPSPSVAGRVDRWPQEKPPVGFRFPSWCRYCSVMAGHFVATSREALPVATQPTFFGRHRSPQGSKESLVILTRPSSFLAMLATFALMPFSVAHATVLSQTTTGLSHSSGETTVTDTIGINTSGGIITGTNDGSVELRVNAPSGQVFLFDSTAYTGIDFVFHFEGNVGVNTTGLNPSAPTFSLIAPTGSLSLTYISSSVADVGGVNFKYITDYGISGVGTFSGFRQLSAFGAGEQTGQTLDWAGGGVTVSSSALTPTSDNGAVVSLVPEPSSFLPCIGLVAGGGVIATRLRRRRKLA
jgi:hypothetical protein